MPAKQPRIGIILTGSDCVSTVPRCLESFIAHTPRETEAVLVQGPAPAFVWRAIAAARARRPFALIEPAARLSQSAQRNLALAALGACDYYVFLDTDTLVGANWLEPLIVCAEEHGADLVQPIFLYGEPARRIIHMAAGRLVFRPDSDGRPGMDEIHDFDGVALADAAAKLGTRPVATDLIEFHCLLATQRAMRRIGAFDEGLGGSMEHADLTLITARAGGRMMLCPAVAVACLHPGYYELCDAAPHAQTWDEALSIRTLHRFAEKHGLAPDGAFFRRQHGWNRAYREVIGVVRRSVPARPARPLPRNWRDLAETLAELDWRAEEVEAVRGCYAIVRAERAASGRGNGEIAPALGSAGLLAAHGATPILVQAALLRALSGGGSRRDYLKDRVAPEIASMVGDADAADWRELPAPADEGAVDRYPLALARALLIRVAEEVGRAGAGAAPAADAVGVRAHAEPVLRRLGFTALVDEFCAALDAPRGAARWRALAGAMVRSITARGA